MNIEHETHPGGNFVYRLSEADRVLTLTVIRAAAFATTRLDPIANKKKVKGTTSRLYTEAVDILHQLAVQEHRSFEWEFETTIPPMIVWAKQQQWNFIRVNTDTQFIAQRTIVP